MARISKEHAVRRNEILDVAQRLVYTKGYEVMTVQDILSELQIAKGTFYHYFASKQDLLEALITRMLNEVEQLVLPIVHDPTIPTLEKFHRFFVTIGTYKDTQKAFLLELIRIWNADENVLVRQKANVAGNARIVPLLAQIIDQGIREGVLATPYPDQAADVAWSLQLGLNEALLKWLLQQDQQQDSLQRIERTISAYTDALERVLGAPSSSLRSFDAETLKAWVIVPTGTIS